MKKFLAAVFFMFVVPFLLYQLALGTPIPLFGITSHPGLAAVGFTAFFDLISFVIGYWFVKGAPLPDN